MSSRPAGMSSDSEDSDCLELVSSFDFDSRSSRNRQHDHWRPAAAGFGSLGESNHEAEISNQTGCMNGFSPGFSNEQAEQPQANGLSEKAIYLSTDPHSDRSIPKPYSSSSPRPKARRHNRLHGGKALPFEELRMAVVQGNLPVIKEILAKGISVDQTVKTGWTPLMFASSCGKAEVVKYLLEKGANPNIHKELFTPLMAACASSHYTEDGLVECVTALINASAMLDAMERHRMTALMFASKEGRIRLVEILLDNGASINKQDNKGWSALCWAATKGHGRIVRLLLERSADPSTINIHGQKPADVARAAGFVEITDVLERAASKQMLEGDMEKLSGIHTHMLPQPCVVKDTKYGDVEMVLTSLGLSSLIPDFQKHDVNMNLLLRITEKDLDLIGVQNLGARKKILEAVVQINKKEWKTTSLPDLRNNSHITLKDAVAMISNINKHVQFIHASVGYLRDQIQTTPRILEIGQEQHSVNKLAIECGDSLKHLSHLKDEVHFFKRHLDKISDNVEFMPADLIVNQKDDGRRWHRHLLASVATVAALATALWFTKPKIFTKLFSLYSYPQKSVLLDL